MKPVIIESPYAGKVERNRVYLNACILDCALRGETPYASHKMLTDSLDDTDPEQRELGIKLGFEMRQVLRACGAVTVVYEDLGISEGMRRGIRDSRDAGVAVEFRKLGKW